MIIVTQCIDGNRVRVRSNLSRELVSTLEYRKMTMDAWLVQDFDVIGRTITYPTMISQHHSAATHSFSPLISSLYIHTSMSPITSSSGLAARRLATSVPLVGRQSCGSGRSRSHARDIHWCVTPDNQCAGCRNEQQDVLSANSSEYSRCGLLQPDTLGCLLEAFANCDLLLELIPQPEAHLRLAGREQARRQRGLNRRAARLHHLRARHAERAPPLARPRADLSVRLAHAADSRRDGLCQHGPSPLPGRL